MHPPESIAVVIPVHNRMPLTQACLDSLSRQTIRPSRIVVIDDGSTDGTGDMIRGRFPEVEIIQGDGSLWWSAAMNLGIEHALEAGCDYVVAVNDDTTFEPTMIESFLAAARDNPCALQGAAGVSSDSGTPVYGALEVSWTTGAFRNVESKTLPDGELQPTDLLCGRGLWIPRETIETIGLFRAELLPQALADYEFTQRAAAAGFPLRVNHAARVLLSESSISSHLGRRRSMKDYRHYLTGMTGAGNVVHFVRYAHLVAPRGMRTWFSFVSVTRRLVGYWLGSPSVRRVMVD